MKTSKKRPTAKQVVKAWKKVTADPHAKEFLAMRLLISKIANMGKGMKEDVIDWNAIGKNATYLADQFLKPKCKTCGHVVDEAGQ